MMALPIQCYNVLKKSTSPEATCYLTEKGRKEARIIRDKHEILEKFAQKLQHPNAHEEAHKLEHHFSDEMLSRLSEFIEGRRKLEAEMPSYIG